MRYAIAIFVLSALALAADRHSSTLLKRAANNLERGDAVVARSREIRKESKRVRVLEQANPHYRDARALLRLALRDPMKIDPQTLPLLKDMERRATQSLVDALNIEAEFYFGRSSTGRAKRLNDEATMLLPMDGRALQLARDIRNAANSGFAVGVGGRR